MRTVPSFAMDRLHEFGLKVVSKSPATPFSGGDANQPTIETIPKLFAVGALPTYVRDDYRSIFNEIKQDHEDSAVDYESDKDTDVKGLAGIYVLSGSRGMGLSRAVNYIHASCLRIGWPVILAVGPDTLVLVKGSVVRQVSAREELEHGTVVLVSEPLLCYKALRKSQSWLYWIFVHAADFDRIRDPWTQIGLRGDRPVFYRTIAPWSYEEILVINEMRQRCGLPTFGTDGCYTAAEIFKLVGRRLNTIFDHCAVEKTGQGPDIDLSRFRGRLSKWFASMPAQAWLVLLRSRFNYRQFKPMPEGQKSLLNLVHIYPREGHYSNARRDDGYFCALPTRWYVEILCEYVQSQQEVGDKMILRDKPGTIFQASGFYWLGNRLNASAVTMSPAYTGSPLSIPRLTPADIVVATEKSDPLGASVVGKFFSFSRDGSPGRIHGIMTVDSPPLARIFLAFALKSDALMRCKEAVSKLPQVIKLLRATLTRDKKRGENTPRPLALIFVVENDAIGQAVLAAFPSGAVFGGTPIGFVTASERRSPQYQIPDGSPEAEHAAVCAVLDKETAEADPCGAHNPWMAQ